MCAGGGVPGGWTSLQSATSVKKKGVCVGGWVGGVGVGVGVGVSGGGEVGGWLGCGLVKGCGVRQRVVSGEGKKERERERKRLTRKGGAWT